jgi:hypothetical protein
MGVATAGLVALGVVQGRVRGPPRPGLSLLFLALTAVTFWQGASAQVRKVDLFMYAKHFGTALRASPLERSALQVVDWLWPTEWNLLKERELEAGDVVVYDQSVYFLAEFFTRDYRTRVEYVPSDVDVKEYLARIDALKPRWVGVQRGSAAERALVERRRAEFLFLTPRFDTGVYRMPR